ncbi:MAG: TM2 domain protein [Berkelbacteria bacterium GW2011_GWA1_36_9]|uniref:TM2 domain protein n=1 Tax=Berkelbacteria bacterium GW2011_GWA1_36_9 TaxID=1618331 RepID=A0A0G0I224_9BACT|nr:MAG: TM2 domain protein [Berkelbacteria bacterium GW2011_GWA1_36_9]
MKNPGLAAILSFFWTGLGQIYNGQIGKGIVFIVVQWVNALLMFVVIGFITFPIVWIWGMIDAYKTAETYNLNDFNHRG